MVRVNGNFDKGNYYLANKDVAKANAEEKVEKNVVEEKAEFQERGEELLAAGMFGKSVNMLVKNDKLDKETADELAEMFAMAGISHRLPTAVEYARIAGATRADAAKFTSFETEKHIELLFANPVMDILAEETQF